MLIPKSLLIISDVKDVNLSKDKKYVKYSNLLQITFGFLSV